MDIFLGKSFNDLEFHDAEFNFTTNSDNFTTNSDNFTIKGCLSEFVELDFFRNLVKFDGIKKSHDIKTEFEKVDIVNCLTYYFVKQLGRKFELTTDYISVLNLQVSLGYLLNLE